MVQDTMFKIEVNKNARCYVQNRIEIEASPETVYKVLADVNHWPEWIGAVKSANLIGQPETGKSFVWKADGYKLTSTFHTLKPGQAIGWTGKAMWLTAVHNWVLLEENGKTVVQVYESMEGFGAGWMKGSLGKRMAKSLLELKDRAEFMQQEGKNM